jgi:hypothetical protein
VQKVICVRDQDEARIEHSRLLPLQLDPEVFEGRIGWGSRRTVEAGGEHVGGHRRRRMGHHPDPAGDDVEMLRILGVKAAHDDEGLSSLLSRQQCQPGSQ